MEKVTQEEMLGISTGSAASLNLSGGGEGSTRARHDRCSRMFHYVWEGLEEPEEEEAGTMKPQGSFARQYRRRSFHDVSVVGTATPSTAGSPCKEKKIPGILALRSHVRTQTLPAWNPQTLLQSKSLRCLIPATGGRVSSQGFLALELY